MFFPFHDDNPTRRLPVVTVGLIIANAAVFLWTISLPEDRQLAVVYRHGFIPLRTAQLQNGLALKLEVPADPNIPQAQAPLPQAVVLPPDRGEIYASTLTCMFLHGGWLHLLGNMWFLWLFGNNVEDRLGHVLYALFYVTGGLFATLCHWWPDPESTLPVIGASGAVAAVLGAYIITWPFAKIKTLVILVVFITVIDLPALMVLGIWFATQVIEAVGAMKLPMGGGVAWWAHIGGFVAGFVVMPLLGLAFIKPPPVPQTITFDNYP